MFNNKLCLWRNSMKIYILISDNGDGSSSINYVNDPEIINKLNDLDDRGLLDYDNCAGVDGDGFHYDTITVPDTCTEESLGIKFSSLEQLYSGSDED